MGIVKRPFSGNGRGTGEVIIIMAKAEVAIRVLQSGEVIIIIKVARSGHMLSARNQAYMTVRHDACQAPCHRCIKRWLYLAYLASLARARAARAPP